METAARERRREQALILRRTIPFRTQGGQGGERCTSRRERADELEQLVRGGR